MTKEELKQEAEEINITYENNVFHCTKNGTKWISIDGEKWYCEEKRVAELEAQIEKMKSPLNCKHSKENGFCKKGNGYCICDKWELED